jgi:hypothetical protein
MKLVSAALVVAAQGLIKSQNQLQRQFISRSTRLAR